jgi:hypothetical protein
MHKTLFSLLFLVFSKTILAGQFIAGVGLCAGPMPGVIGPGIQLGFAFNRWEITAVTNTNLLFGYNSTVLMELQAIHTIRPDKQGYYYAGLNAGVCGTTKNLPGKEITQSGNFIGAVVGMASNKKHHFSTFVEFSPGIGYVQTLRKRTSGHGVNNYDPSSDTRDIIGIVQLKIGVSMYLGKAHQKKKAQ